MEYPKEVQHLKPIELKLGIKSSYKKLKPSLAFLYLLWKSSGEQYSYIYGEQMEKNSAIELTITDYYFNNIVSLLKNNGITINNDELREAINKNELFINQMEPIKVALELIWRIAIVEFVDPSLSYSVERKKINGKLSRFKKKVNFTKNIDLIDQIAMLSNLEESISVFYAWLVEKPLSNSKVEDQLVNAFTFISEEAIYQIKIGENGELLKFTQSGIYETTAKLGEVSITDINENKGSSRILKNIVSEGLNKYLFNQKNIVYKKNNVSNEWLLDYSKRVNSFINLTQVDIEEVFLGESDVMDHNQDEFEVLENGDFEKKFREWLSVKVTNSQSESEEYIKESINIGISSMKLLEKIWNESHLDQQINYFVEPKESFMKATIIDLQNDPKINEFDKKRNKYPIWTVKNYYTFIEELFSNRFKINDENRKQGGINKIFYGAPGTGKSYEVNKQYTKFKRVTFHPEYTYFDFIGGLRPVQDETTNKISYEFVPGPFTDALIDALFDKENEHGLIIEEINRGNTAAIFGDIFQLLDRKNDGRSQYDITNKDVQDYIQKIKGIRPETVYIPSNFSLIATMNSADQGVYVMDSAFKRRWQFEYIPISFEHSDFSDVNIAGFNIPWKYFGEKLNTHLSNIGVEEDKLIGQRFISIEDMQDEEKVAAKLLIYLWDDVVRYRRKELFGDIKTFSNLVTTYQKISSKCFVPALAVELEKFDKRIGNNSMKYSGVNISTEISNVAEEEAEYNG